MNFFNNALNVYSAYNKEQGAKRDYNLSLAQVKQAQQPPTQSRAIDRQINNSNSVSNGVDNKTLMYVGGGVVGVVLLALVLK